MNKTKEQYQAKAFTCPAKVQVENETKCPTCGCQTYPQGACHICFNCGNTSGCS